MHYISIIHSLMTTPSLFCFYVIMMPYIARLFTGENTVKLAPVGMRHALLPAGTSPFHLSNSSHKRQKLVKANKKLCHLFNMGSSPYHL